jgi:hypothetical protein
MMATTAWIGGGSSVKQRLTALQAFRRDCNPLLRAVDRAEAVAMTAMTAAFVLGWLVIAILAGRWADQQGLLIEHAQGDVHAVMATQLESGAQGADTTGLDGAWVEASWRLPDGHAHHGLLFVALNSKAGQRQLIYVGPNGQPTRPPVTADGVRDQVAFTVFSCTMGIGIVYGLALGTLRLLFNRRRMAGWQRDWDAVGPTWLRQD